MKKVIFIVFSLLIFFLIARYLIADTGLYFAVDYLKNKIDINNTAINTIESWEVGSWTDTVDTGTQMPYNNKVSNQGTMQDEFLTRCVVDPTKRTIYIYSSEGDTKEIVCDTVDQFMNVLEVIRNTCPEDALVYAEPLEV